MASSPAVPHPPSFIRRFSLLLLACAVPLAGCATIFGAHQKDFEFTTTPTGATVSVDGAPEGTTPVKIKLSNHKEHVVVFHMEGYQDITCTLSKGTGAGWVVLDILGGLIPVIVDAGTNNWTQTKGKGCDQPLRPVVASAS